jgi:lysophospholipase
MSASPLFPKIPAEWSLQSIKIRKDSIHINIWRKKKYDTGRMLFIVHGQAEQSDRYEHFPFYLSSSVDMIAAIDLPGHGKSKGIRGHINNFDQYSESCIDALQAAHQTFQDVFGKKPECHWIGHSLGGLITLRTLLKKSDLPLTSVCASAPLLGLSMPVPIVKKTFAVIGEPVIGSLPLSNELSAELLSHDESVVSYYSENPLNHDRVTPRFFVRLQREMELLKAPQQDFAYPLMILSPLGDSIVSWKAAFKFFERLHMKEHKKELQSFPGFFHESFNETGKDRAFLALENWILKNSKMI